MGAWIEILNCYETINRNRSLPLWERGLKFYTKEKNKLNAWSLPLWERGLKSQTPQTMQTPQTVAPLVGAWIEIYASR